MENIKFGNFQYSYTQVTDSLPEKYSDKLRKIVVTKGGCLNNSRKVSDHFREILMVEGFLVSQFSNGEIECVGHVWNCINGEHFDLTVNLTDDTEKIRCNSYFVAEIYEEANKKVEERWKLGSNSFSVELEKHLVFKTNVKNIEIDLREHLKKNDFCFQ